MQISTTCPRSYRIHITLAKDMHNIQQRMHTKSPVFQLSSSDHLAIVETLKNP
uniref:Uncharacterized protein n=1 Tax=Rhizophora mucronata TaxID=61149 RepID=A0A2P2M3T1_RHIMU